MTELLQEAIRADKSPFREIARGTGLNIASLHHFRAGTRSLRLDKADKLAEYYGIVSKREKG